MHNRIFCFTGIGCIALATLGYRFDSNAVLWTILLAVCLIGVPHGGLDHKTGRKQFASRWGKYWSIPFFGGYLAISVATVLGWLLNPLITAVAFFLVSAMHFGREDQLVHQPTSPGRVLLDTASGGLVIWIPAVARPAEFQQILEVMIPTGFATSLDAIVYLTKGMALVLIPIALIEIAYQVGSQSARKLGGRTRAIRQIILIALFATTPILVSFAVYFCGWHSIRGLRQLMHENQMKLGELGAATIPMSIGAIAMVGLGMWYWNSGRVLSDELTRSLFIGLSALAVPHLALHALPMDSTYRQLNSASRFGGVA